MSSSTDALCGPSNPLQQLKNHTSLDRTLHQDRLTTSPTPHPGQAFRSQDPRGALLDPEFEAFQDGVSMPADLPEFYPPQMHQQPAPAAFARTATGPDWAADFHRRLHISSPPPLPAHYQQQQQQRPPTADWAQGFLSQTTPRASQTSAPSPLAFQQRARYGGFVPGAFQSTFSPPQPSLEMITPGQVKGKERVEEFDDEAFERAFEQAREDLLTETERNAAMATEEDVGLEEKTTDSEAVQATISSSTMDTLPEGDLREDGIQEEPRTLPDDEDDALAATAQELLDKVQHHQSDKFRHSNFLSLMRRLADREVRVLGDKVVEVDNSRPPRTPLLPPRSRLPSPPAPLPN
ncbi:hypothetical protein M433DRAFT_156659 [Acidomyces richmondensis BFW]|nr:MAG: hypothetical protein FE78DRAFT_90050 [Acidomyces sp. 'richmondensis']KYG43502.1 hypothetical protein M433DRAFT_156659 [Acidomyces richmondensis BFW]